MSETAPPDDDTLLVRVVRTGGIAGVRRQWQVRPVGRDADRWMVLIDRCPWRAAPDRTPAPDRFVWDICVRMPEGERRRSLGERQLTGPWRELVDAVREAAGRPSPGPG